LRNQPKAALTDQASDAGALHGPKDVSGTDRADRALSARPEGAENGIVTGHDTFEGGRIEDVSLDQSRRPLGVLDLELFGVAGEGGHLVAEGERLVDQVATDRAGRTEDDELHGVLLFSFDGTFHQKTRHAETRKQPESLIPRHLSPGRRRQPDAFRGKRRRY
jgi:hypothetical protein